MQKNINIVHGIYDFLSKKKKKKKGGYKLNKKETGLMWRSCKLSGG